VVNVITNLRWFRLGIENLDNIILIVKNLPNDVCVECALNPKIMNNFMIFEATMIIKNNKLIKNILFLKKSLTYFEAWLVFLF
jgi:hypothetical protein